MPVLTKEELLTKLRELQASDDPEIAHHEADDALLKFIDDAEVTEAFVKIKRWYA